MLRGRGCGEGSPGRSGTPVRASARPLTERELAMVVTALFGRPDALRARSGGDEQCEEEWR